MIDQCPMPDCTRPIQRVLCEKHLQTSDRYDIDPGELPGLFAAGCALCSKKTDLVVDHDHHCCPGAKTCGTCTRGILCRGCNVRVGHFDVDPSLAERAAAYSAANEHLLLKRRTRILAPRGRVHRYPIGPKPAARADRPMNRGTPRHSTRLDARGRISLRGHGTPGYYQIEKLDGGALRLTPISPLS